MEFSSQLLFFFSALGAFNGLLIGCYFLLFAKPKSYAYRFLGMSILMLSIRVGKSVFYSFNPDLAFGYLQFGLTACFYIGPFLYFYVKSLCQPNSNIHQEWKYHLLILTPIVLFVNIKYPFETNIPLWRPWFLRGIYYVWFSYIILATFSAREIIQTLFQRGKSMNRHGVWILSLLIGNMILVIIYLLLDFTYYISGALTFTFLFYLSWAYLYFNRNNRIVYLTDQKKYGDQKIDVQEAATLEASLKVLMEDKKIYLDHSLKLPATAAQLGISPHRLSQFLNDNLSTNFSKYVNQYRIEAAKKLLASQDHLTLEAVGQEVGFRSKSTFYGSFKKNTGQTPASFKNALKSMS